MEKIQIGRIELLHFSAHQLLVHCIATQLGIGFPVNRVHIEIEPDLIFTGEEGKEVNRFVGFADPLML